MISTLNKSRQEYLSMFEGCAQLMAAQAYNAKNIETGGGLYGLWSHAGRAVVMLATPAGPGACYERAHFAVDHEYVTALNEKLQRRFGIQYLGNWHSHHRLGLDHPSSGDVAQIHGVASKNNIPRMIQLVITYANGQDSTPNTASLVSSVAKVGKNMRKSISKLTVHPGRTEEIENDHLSMRINSFVYPESTKGSCIRCSVKILSGQSPIRQVLKDSRILWQPGVSSVTEFPLDRVIYDHLETTNKIKSTQHVLPADLANQLNYLPGSVINGTETYSQEDFNILSLPFENKRRVFILYKDTKERSEIYSVHLVGSSGNMTPNISGEILAQNPDPSIAFIYKHVEKDKRFDRLDM